MYPHQHSCGDKLSNQCYYVIGRFTNNIIGKTQLNRYTELLYKLKKFNKNYDGRLNAWYIEIERLHMVDR